MVEVRNISKAYGQSVVLNIPGLTVGEGECLGIVGNNGAGKTTLFRLVLDLIEATSGEVSVDGKNVVRSEHWKSKVGSFLEEDYLIDFMTVEEYYYFIGKLHHKSKDDIDLFMSSMSDFFNGEILGNKKFIRDYSKGNQKKIGIVAALIGDPKILILDEPFTSLDPSSQIRLKRFLVDLQKECNITMLISSHDLSHITEVCNRIVILEKGIIVKDIFKDENTLKELEGYFAV